MKLITSKLTSKYVIGVFGVLEALVKMKPEFIRVFDESLFVTKTSRNINNSIEHFLEIFSVIEKAVKINLDIFFAFLIN